MRKLLALTLSLLLVFSLVPVAMVSAEGETYVNVFDASSETASSKIAAYSGKSTIETYAVPTDETDDEGNPVTQDRTVLKYVRTSRYNSAFANINVDFRSVVKGAVGVRFWLAADTSTIPPSPKGISLGFKNSSLVYRTAGEDKANWYSTNLSAQGATYEWYWNTTSNVWQTSTSGYRSPYGSKGKANALFTEQFLASVTEFQVGVQTDGSSYNSLFYIDDVELIYPAGVTPAPIEYTATFVGTETAVLTEEVAPIKSDAANNDAVVMPEATLAEGTLAGWALNGDITKVYAPGATVNITNNATFYAVNANKPVLATPAAPVASVVSGATVTLKAVTGAVYSKDGATWQTSNTFTGLTPGATYTFYQKMPETLTHAESAVSEGLTVTTPVEYVYEAENCSPKGYKAGATTAHTLNNTYDTDDGAGNYKYVQDNNTNAVGAKNVFTVKNLPTGIFTLTTYARNVVNSRSSYEVTLVDANGEVVGSFGVVNFADQTYKFPGATYHSANYLENEVTVAEEGTYTLVFTNVKAGDTGMCLDSFTFKKVADYNLTEVKVKIDGEEVAVLEPGATYTIPTPATGYYYTDGETDYYGGEQVVVERYLNLTTKVLTAKVVYTMDEGKRLPEAKSYAYVQDVSVDYNGEYIEVNGNYKIALKAQMDRCAYFKLPKDWANKPYYKPTKITFTASKDSTGSMAFKSLRFASSVDSGNYAPSGETHDIVTSISYINPTTYTIDVTEDMYDCFYISGQVYSSVSWNPTTPIYLLIDDVTIDYEYDFDYVEPEFAGETTDVITTEDAASIRLGEVNGIRFYTTIDTVALAELVGDKKYEVGTLIAPKDIAGDYLTIEDNCAVVPYDMSKELWDGQIVGSIVKIKDKETSYSEEFGNLARDFVARAYVLVDGVYYYSATQSVRNIAGIADAYINTSGSGYDTLDADTKALVEAWAKAND